MARRKADVASFNRKVAGQFREVAELLRLQEANPFRVNAYLRAAQTIEALDRDLREILRKEGIPGLTRLPTIGSGLASSIEEIARRGTLSRLERLRGTSEPGDLFRTVPGIGPELSRRIHDELHIDTLEQLELAAHDDSLESVPGVGARRAAAIRAGVAAILGRSRPVARRGGEPPIALLLDIDAEYRRKARAGRLPRLAPKRFNPEGEAWLPVMHAERSDWHFTVLFSNTARAHELDRTRDWVVIYFYDDDHAEGQCTVVTETRGVLEGRRVVRGREKECREHYGS